MRLTRLAWDNLSMARRLLAPILFGGVLASFSTAAEDSVAVPSLDSLVLQGVVETVGQDTLKRDSVAVEPVAKTVAVVDSSIKTVLYLGGGERSPWFQLGVLYAIEEYGIPVDSIVATSWGAWVGALWARGVPLDDIQKMMLDSAIAPYVGHDLSASENRLGYNDVDSLELPVSVTGFPSIRQRFTLSVDSSKFPKRHKKMLAPDSAQVGRALARLRFQESLYRQRSNYQIPFSVQSCESGNPVIVGNATAQVIESLPLWNAPRNASANNRVSGELCPYYAMPVEDNAKELSIIVVSDPLRAPVTGSAPVQLLKRHVADILASQPGVIVRAHTILDTARAAWIQAGFTSLEKQLSEFAALNNRRKDYSVNRFGYMPWFRFEPTFDSLSSEVHHVVKTYWNDSDTGMVAPERFALRLIQNPAYDSVDFNMQPGGNLWVDASVHPTFDIAAGGFGSSALGANAYVEASMHYVDHVEIELVLAGFWGGNSYGVQPRLNISKFWNRHWNLQFGYDYLKLVPLHSFNNTVDRHNRIVSEERSDLLMNLDYDIDSRQSLSAEFLFGFRTYEMDPVIYGDHSLKTFPVSPMLHYRNLKGENDNWFANNGYALNVWGGFESIGFDDGILDVVPIYWKLLADARYTISPKPYTTFSVAAVGAVERFHDEGHGYVFPSPFGYAPLDIAYRLHAAPTPWSTEWYNVELSSHEYALARLSAGIHCPHFGVWLFGAYYHDFENSPYAALETNKFIFEPALRFVYRSVEVYTGMNRIVDNETMGDLKHLYHYNFFIRIGNYGF